MNSWKMCTVSTPTTEKDLKAIMRADTNLKLLDTDYPKKFYYELVGDDIFEL